ncbi:hypothetical protein HAX54_033030, partial [Datura stramonium]|nr:hypothetical protein [Datura stramonium]
MVILVVKESPCLTRYAWHGPVLRYLIKIRNTLPRRHLPSKEPNMKEMQQQEVLNQIEQSSPYSFRLTASFRDFNEVLIGLNIRFSYSCDRRRDYTKKREGWNLVNLSLKCSSAPCPSCNDCVPSPHDLSAPIAPSVSVTERKRKGNLLKAPSYSLSQRIPGIFFSWILSIYAFLVYGVSPFAAFLSFIFLIPHVNFMPVGL